MESVLLHPSRVGFDMFDDGGRQFLFRKLPIGECFRA